MAIGSKEGQCRGNRSTRKSSSGSCRGLGFVFSLRDSCDKIGIVWAMGDDCLNRGCVCVRGLR